MLPELMALSGEDVESFCDVAKLAEVVYKEEPLKGPAWPLVLAPSLHLPDCESLPHPPVTMTVPRLL